MARARFWLGVAVSTVLVLAFAPGLTYLSLGGRACAIVGSVTGFFLGGRRPVLSAWIVWGAVAGFAVCFIAELATGTLPGHHDCLEITQFHLVIFFMSGARVVVEIGWLWLAIEAAVRLTPGRERRWPHRRGETWWQVAVVVAAALAIALIEIRATCWRG
jgi:hypothetical protein